MDIFLEHLKDNLYKYRLFISEDIFKKLHRFKVIANDARNLRNAHVSEDLLFDNSARLVY